MQIPQHNFDDMLEISQNTPAEIHLREATDLLKSVFGKYEKPPVENCVDPLDVDGPISDEVRSAWAKSPWEYRPQDIDYFIRHSLLRGCPAEHDEIVLRMKYWLPRQLHGLSEGEADSMVTAEWYISENLFYAKWLRWPADEVDAVQKWCAAWLRACIDCDDPMKHVGHPFGSRSVGTCVDFAVHIGLDVSFVLYDIASDVKPSDVHAIHDIVTSFVPEVIRRDRLEDDRDPTAMTLRALLRWMLHPTTSERLERAFFRFAESDRALAREISETSEWVEIVRKSYAADPRGLPNWLADL